MLDFQNQINKSKCYQDNISGKASQTDLKQWIIQEY